MVKVMGKYFRFLNLIRQHWFAIVLTIALAVICALSIRYALSRPFDPSISGIILAIGIIVITSTIADADATSTTISRNLTRISTCISPFAGAVIGLGVMNYFTTSTSTMTTIITIIVSAIIGFVVYLVITFFVDLIIFISITNELWERYKKYCLSSAFLFIIFTVLLASSFQNVDARSWKFDRGTGAFSSGAVFILPGSTLEKEYFVVDRKPQRKIFAYVWVPAIEDAAWSGDREPNSLRKEAVLTCTFKNYKAYQKIHGKLPEIFVTSTSRKKAPEDVGLTLLRYTGLTSEDVEITKVDGLE